MVPGAKRKNSRIDGFINVQICVLSNDQYEVFGNLDAAHLSSFQCIKIFLVLTPNSGKIPICYLLLIQ